MPPKAVKQYLAAIGRKGGAVKSEAKTAAVRANGARGGRPPTLSKRVRLTRIRERIKAGKDINPAQAALHYADEMGKRAALAWAKEKAFMAHAAHGDASTERPWWDAVVVALERGVR